MPRSSEVRDSGRLSVHGTNAFRAKQLFSRNIFLSQWSEEDIPATLNSRWTFA